MKKKLYGSFKKKRIFGILLSLLMLCSFLPLFSSFCVTADAAGFKTGDVIEFGSYPQTQVTDTTIIAALNKISGDWISYNYYCGTGNYGTMKSGDFMKYRDVTYNGEKYRGVLLEGYRPTTVCYPAYTSIPDKLSDYYYQPEYGYELNIVYWFKYEPLKWIVMNPTSGLVLCQQVIDGQPFNNIVYWRARKGDTPSATTIDSGFTITANNYSESTIRTWLNDTFLNTAFSGKQQDRIKTTTVDNSSPNSEYSNPNTEDKVFLLSKSEATNSTYGLGSNTSRTTTNTEYAAIQGIYNSCPNPSWWLRTAYYYDSGIYTVAGTHSNTTKALGDAENYDWAERTQGVRPALVLTSICEHSYKDEVVSPTCAAKGYTKHTCTICGDSYNNNYVNATGKHTFTAETVDDDYLKTPATCLKQAVYYKSCAVCGLTSEGTAGEAVFCAGELAAHTKGEPVVVSKNPPGCVQAGSYEEIYYCTVEGCGAEISRTEKEIAPKGHTLTYHTAKAATLFEAGWEAYEECSKCDYTTYKEIPKLKTVDTGRAFTENGILYAMPRTISFHLSESFGGQTVVKKADDSVVDNNFYIGTDMTATLFTEEGTPSGTLRVVVFGDIDGDGMVSAADARLTLRATVGLEALSDCQKIAAAVSGENEISAGDARHILRASVGLEDADEWLRK